MKVGVALSFTILCMFSGYSWSESAQEYYDPLSPIAPKDRSECVDYREKMNVRVDYLLAQFKACGDRVRESNPITYQRQLYDFPDCPIGTKAAFAFYECTPSWRDYCYKWKEREENYKECLENVSAFEDLDKESLNQYSEFYKEVEKQTKKAYDKANTGKSTGQKLAKKMFNDSMKQIAKIHQDSLRLLAIQKEKARKIKVSNDSAKAAQPTQKKILQERSAELERLKAEQREREEWRREQEFLAEERARAEREREEERRIRQEQSEAWGSLFRDVTKEYVDRKHHDNRRRDSSSSSSTSVESEGQGACVCCDPKGRLLCYNK